MRPPLLSPALRRTLPWLLVFLLMLSGGCASPLATVKGSSLAENWSVGECLHGTPVHRVKTGRVLLVEFWNSWHPESRWRSEQFRHLAGAYASKGLDAVRVNVFELDESRARRLVSEYTPGFPCSVHLDDRNSEPNGRLAAWLLRNGLEDYSTLLVSGEGRVLYAGDPHGLATGTLITAALAGDPLPEISLATAVAPDLESAFRSEWATTFSESGRSSASDLVARAPDGEDELSRLCSDARKTAEEMVEECLRLRAEGKAGEALRVLEGSFAKDALSPATVLLRHQLRRASSGPDADAADLLAFVALNKDEPAELLELLRLLSVQDGWPGQYANIAGVLVPALTNMVLHLPDQARLDACFLAGSYFAHVGRTEARRRVEWTGVEHALFWYQKSGQFHRLLAVLDSLPARFPEHMTPSFLANDLTYWLGEAGDSRRLSDHLLGLAGRHAGDPELLAQLSRGIAGIHDDRADVQALARLLESCPASGTIAVNFQLRARLAWISGDREKALRLQRSAADGAEHEPELRLQTLILEGMQAGRLLTNSELLRRLSQDENR